MSGLSRVPHFPRPLGSAFALPQRGGHWLIHRTSSVSLTAVPCQAFLNIPSLEHSWLVHLPHPTPSISHRPRALLLAWATQASASNRQARSSLPDVSSLENQTIKGIAQRDKGRLFPHAWFLSGCWLHSQCSPAELREGTAVHLRREGLLRWSPLGSCVLNLC